MDEREAFHKRYVDKDGKLTKRHSKESIMINSDNTVDMDALVKQIKALSQSKQLALQEVVNRLASCPTGNVVDRLSIMDSLMNLLVSPNAPDRERKALGICDEYKAFILSLGRIGLSTSTMRSALIQRQEAQRRTECSLDEETGNEDVLSNEEALAIIDRLTGDLKFQYKLLTEPRYQDVDIQPEFPAGSEPAIQCILAKLAALKSLVLISK